MANKVTVYLALGSNIDDRMAFLAKARDLLANESGIELAKASKVYETEPWPRNELPNDHPHSETGQKWFLNQVLQIETTLSPQELLKVLGTIEQKVGRTKREHWGAREIDIDILLYGNQIIDTPDLQIPHRHIQDRQFILVPLVEISPKLKDPMTDRNFIEILERVKAEDDHKVTPFL
jgi:2-amino-4-hydroxy-6-hydroxymethyldihydropteridine diphosphokinase